MSLTESQLRVRTGLVKFKIDISSINGGNVNSFNEISLLGKFTNFQVSGVDTLQGLSEKIEEGFNDAPLVTVKSIIEA